MDINSYFQSYHNYFWQWEDDVEVIGIPNNNTIAFRGLVVDILEILAPQGLPRFGSLLLAIIATNPNGKMDANVVSDIMNHALEDYEETTLFQAITFLKLLSEIPNSYKSGNKRILLFQTIFTNCHNINSVKNSLKIRDEYHSNKRNDGKNSNKIAFSKTNFNKDFGTIALLGKKFKSIEDIINKMASLPDFPDDLLQLEENILDETVSKDLLEQLVENDKTFHVGSLIKRIWSGLNIPVHSSLPSQQPLGGVSDLTNKGDFDKLLISEFANDDLVFMSRLANNEALYIQREIPPTNNDLHRVILIDVSLKNWGTPKIVAFATALAIAKHPKTDIECKVFAIGNSFYPIDIQSIDTIIEGLQILEGSLNASNGLHEFFKEYPANKNQEVFIITEYSTLKQVEMLKALTENHAGINYWIHTDAEGNIDIFKKQQNSKKHLQHLLLPLEELWKREVKTKKSRKIEHEHVSEFPILFNNSMNDKKVLSTIEGDFFMITSEKTLLKRYEKLTANQSNYKGWEMLHTNLPYFNGEIAIGQLKSEEYVLLMFNPQKKEITLLSLDTKSQIHTDFLQWENWWEKGFTFFEDKFHINNWSIDIDGNIDKKTAFEPKTIKFRKDELNDLENKYSFSSSANILKNVNWVYINQLNELVFNVHSLKLNSGSVIKLDKSFNREKVFNATKTETGEFEFTDGSVIEINRSGMLILKSSNQNIPYIYVPSVIDAALGVATENEFAGYQYYHKEKQMIDVYLEEVGENVLNTVKMVKEFTGCGLKEAKDIVDATKGDSLTFLKSSMNSQYKAYDKKFNDLGAKLKTNFEEGNSPQTIIPTTEFFQKYIQAFIKNIQDYGVKN
jgi:ribosomal protein L7/L12